MNVEQNGKKLWHIQNTNILFDSAPYDLFLWAKNEPTQEELAKAFRKDYGNDERMVKEWLTSSEIYAVRAYDMNDIMQQGNETLPPFDPNDIKTDSEVRVAYKDINGGINER